MNGIYKVSLGERHGLFIKNGNLYSWGFNNGGQLGLGETYMKQRCWKMVCGERLKIWVEA